LNDLLNLEGFCLKLILFLGDLMAIYSTMAHLFLPVPQFLSLERFSMNIDYNLEKLIF